ncbi:hypothetical protein HMPREF9406_2743 [Clostridium sp. HGF2]|nr:hypothetical protein HMPREF9406_2743 [Clostridium sp. HGF2]
MCCIWRQRMYKATNCNQCCWFMMKAPAGVFFFDEKAVMQ